MRQGLVVWVLLANLALAGCLNQGLTEGGDPRPAPDFNLTTLDGKQVNLSTYGDRVLILDVMASWCVPCKAQMPHLKEVVERHPDDAAVLSVAIQDTEEDLRAFRSEHNATWDMALDTDRVFNRYEATKIPSLFIIHDGKIYAEDQRALTTADELSAAIHRIQERADGA